MRGHVQWTLKLKERKTMTFIDEWTEILMAAEPTLSIQEAQELAEQIILETYAERAFRSQSSKIMPMKHEHDRACVP